MGEEGDKTVQNIVILGAGTSGAFVLKSLLSQLKKKKDLKVFITVIEKQKSYFWFHGIGRSLIDPEFASKMFVNDLDSMVPPAFGKGIYFCYLLLSIYATYIYLSTYLEQLSILITNYRTTSNHWVS
jgi:hypothetical protein